jgi:hypothetical protein
MKVESQSKSMLLGDHGRKEVWPPFIYMHKSLRRTICMCTSHDKTVMRT